MFYQSFLTIVTFDIFTALDKLLLSCSRLSQNIPFHEQSLLCFDEKEGTNFQQSKFVTANQVKCCMSYERNAAGYIYQKDDLRTALHGTIPTCDIPTFRQKKFSAANDTSFVHIPSSHNFMSSDKKNCIFNQGSKFTCVDNTYVPHKSKDDVIAHCETIITNMFKHGLADKFSFKEKKRASTVRGEKQNSSSKCPPLLVMQQLFLSQLLPPLHQRHPNTAVGIRGREVTRRRLRVGRNRIPRLLILMFFLLYHLDGRLRIVMSIPRTKQQQQVT